MREVVRSAIVPYSADAMFELVADVDAYSDFVPGCSESCVEQRDEDGSVLASLGFTIAGQKRRFTTRNRLNPPSHIGMSLVEGPFSELHGDWNIESLGADGCRLELSMRFAFDNRVLDMMLGPLFEQTCGRLVDAFVRRAHALHGDAE